MFSIDYEIFLKLLMSLAFSVIVGYNQEINHSSAGLKTHTMVGIGATIIALIQYESMERVMDLYFQYGSGIPIRIDPVRLVAQIVSGIGFLGAGSIIMTKRNIFGLTTASTIWAVAAIGIAIGLGMYQIAIFGIIFVFIVLTALLRISKRYEKRSLVIKLYAINSSLLFLRNFFNECKVRVEVVNFGIEELAGEKIHKYVVTIDDLGDYTYTELIEELLSLDQVASVEMSNLEF